MSKYFFSLLVIAFLSCNTRTKQNKTGHSSVPQALQDNKTLEIANLSKRGPDDLVEELYKEKLSTSPALKDLENKIQTLYRSKADSVKAFHDYDGKNRQYYSSAFVYINQVNDSSLRTMLQNALQESKRMYQARIEKLNALDSLLRLKISTAGDKHIAVKLYVTLTIMEKYQQENLPPGKPLQAIIDGYDKLFMQMDSVITKSK